MFPHDTIFGSLFWIGLGLVYGLIIVSARIWATDLGLKMTWWKWTLAMLWFAFLNVGIAGGTTLLGEFEYKAGWYFIGITLTVSIILGVGLWRLLWAGRQKPKKQSENV